MLISHKINIRIYKQTQTQILIQTQTQILISTANTYLSTKYIFI